MTSKPPIPRLTATVAAWVREAIASEIIEAGVVVVGGMKEGANGPSRAWRDASDFIY